MKPRPYTGRKDGRPLVEIPGPVRRRLAIRFMVGVVAALVPARLWATNLRRVVHVGRFGEALDELRSANIKRLALHGYVHGKNLDYEIIDSGDLQDGGEFSKLIRKVVDRQPDVILTSSDWRALAFKKVIRDIPIVFHSVSDPVESGLVKSLNHPGGNVTGASSRDRDLAAKRFETLLEVAPKARRIAWCSIKDAVGATHFAEIAAAAASRGLEMIRVEVEPGTLETDFLMAVDVANPDAVIIPTVNPKGPIAGHLMRRGIPAIYSDNRVVEAGGLLSLGERTQDRALRAIDIAVLILRGRSPATIPVDQLAIIHLAVNLKTAATMRLQIPNSIRLRAHQLIQ
jgi:putative ABC transport system substrate-binding protein